jgi:hypothetical protein
MDFSNYRPHIALRQRLTSRAEPTIHDADSHVFLQLLSSTQITYLQFFPLAPHILHYMNSSPPPIFSFFLLK